MAQVVAQKVDRRLFAEYQRARDRLVEAQLSREAAAEMEVKITAALKQMEEQGLKVFRAQKFIVDEVY